MARKSRRPALRPPIEERHAAELSRLTDTDEGARPRGWRLSPRAVRSFIAGDERLGIERKFYGDDALVERAIVGLASNRGLLLVGEPGTAKTLLSELLAAAISGASTHSIQGTAGTTEDQIRYSWNYALLLDRGPCLEALVPAPLWTGMTEGLVVRFEEITRCAPEVQDSLVSVLSDMVLIVPELDGADRVVLARPGFNVIATANLRDRGVHEMSSALKRRFNFETVHPIRELDLEVRLVADECRRLLDEAEAPVELPVDVVEVLVTAFHELREGRTLDGVAVERPSTILSTAEAVSVAMSAGLDAFYYGEKRLTAEHVARHLAGAVIKDDAADLDRLRRYVDIVVAGRARSKHGPWAAFAKAEAWKR